MKKRIVFQCDYCGKFKVKEDTMRRHEEYCTHNPHGKGCYNCAFCFMGDYDDGIHGKGERLPICYKDDELCIGRMKKDCSYFKRAGSPYFLRTEQELREAEDLCEEEF